MVLKTRRAAGRLRLTAGVLGLAAVAMVGASFAAVPLYRLFCQVTGYGGTTRVEAAAPGAVAGRTITVRFNADVARGMPWRFRPREREVEVRPGEAALVVYEALNPSARTIIGSATFNVTPDKVGRYFNKIACFCFDEQRLAPGEGAELPVTFFVDPGILDDPNTRDVSTITLSYTFFDVSPEKGDGARVGSNAAAAPGS